MKFKNLFVIATVLFTSLTMVNCTADDLLEEEGDIIKDEIEIRGIKDGEIKDEHI